MDASGGLLKVEPAAAQVAVSLGIMEAVNGNLTIAKPLSGSFGGTANVAASRTMDFSSGWTLANAGVLNLNGGVNAALQATVTGNAVVQQGASVNVTGNAAFRNHVTFGQLATVNITAAADVLRLEGGASIPFNGVQTVVIQGSGRLSNLPGSTLDISRGVTSIDVDLQNAGMLEIDSAGPGTVGVSGNFVQTATGNLSLDIEGTVPGSLFDRFVVIGDATLNGLYRVAVNGFLPSLGDSFDVLDFASASGAPLFDLPTLGVGLAWDTSSFLSSGVLSIAASNLNCDFNGDSSCNGADIDLLVMEIAGGGSNLLYDINGDALIDINDVNTWLSDAGTQNIGAGYLGADANLDGVVDGQDFVVWNSNKFSNTGKWSMADFDASGVTDGVDFIKWNTLKFMSSDALLGSATSPASVPEPNVTWIALGLVAGIVRRKSA